MYCTHIVPTCTVYLYCSPVLPCRQLGVSALVAITCIAAAVPINSRLVAASAAKLRVALKHGDTRAKLESELVSGRALLWFVLQPSFSTQFMPAKLYW
jgi:hypothetical protein